MEMPNRLIGEEDVLDFINLRLNTSNSTVPQKYIEEFFPFDRFNLKREYPFLIRKIISDLATKKRILVTYRSVPEGKETIRVPIIEPYDEEKAKEVIPVEPIEKRIHLKKYVRRSHMREFSNALPIFLLVSCIVLLVWTLIFVKGPPINREEVIAALSLITILIYIGFCLVCLHKE